MGFGGLIHRVDMAEEEAWDYVNKNFQNWKEKRLKKKKGTDPWTTTEGITKIFLWGMPETEFPQFNIKQQITHPGNSKNSK